LLRTHILASKYLLTLKKIENFSIFSQYLDYLSNKPHLHFERNDTTQRLAGALLLSHDIDSEN